MMAYRKRVLDPRPQSREKQENEESHHYYHGVDRAEEHVSVKDGLSRFLGEITPTTCETVKFQDSLGRVLGADVASKVDIPLLNRSSRDGYALKVGRGYALHSGSEFQIIGDVPIGEKTNISIGNGVTVRVATGSFIPEGANSVVMKEYALESNGSVKITKDVGPNQNIVRKGEDIRKGTIILRRGTVVRPHTIAILALVGASRVRVFRKPRVAFFSTGNELVDASTSKGDGKINDVNRPYIESMIRDLGAIPVDLGIARDDYNVIRRKIIEGLASDALFLSAGSSVGERDYAARAAESIPGLDLMYHGVAMRPSSPTGLGVYRGKKPFVMLPGFPTSMITSFLVFCRPAILKRGGSIVPPMPMVKAKLLENYLGRKGLTQFLRVKVVEKNGEYFANIIRPTEAQYSSWLKDANGIAVLDPSLNGVESGEELPVFLIGDLKTED